MTRVLRVIDTGLRPARWNVAMTAALAELHGEGRIANVLRFHRYPESVLVGRHQALADAVDVGACRAFGIEIARRMSGGGAVYMAPGALAWDFAVCRRDVPAHRDAANAAICEAIAAGLARLGLPARYRTPGEIEVEGRKIYGSSGYFEGRTLLHQGTVLLEADIGRMAEVLKLPPDESAHKKRGLARRLVGISELLGRVPDPGAIETAVATAIAGAFGFILQTDAPQAQEVSLADVLFAREMSQDSFVFDATLPRAVRTVAGRDGVVSAYVRLHPGDEGLIEQIWLTGQFEASPARAIADLEVSLRGLPVRQAAQRALAALSDASVRLRGTTGGSIAAAIVNAAEKQQQAGLS